MYFDKNTKEKILREIEALPDTEQQTVLGIVENYIHSQVDETEWNTLPPQWKLRVEQSLQQADSGHFVLNEDAVSYIRKKYGLNNG